MFVDALNDALPVFRALGELSRARIVGALIEREGTATVGEIQEAVEMPQSTVSRHLRILLDAKLLRVTRNGTQRAYHLDVQPEALIAVEKLIAEVRACQTTERD